MPIVYIHGVAVRDQKGKTLESKGNSLLERLVEDVAFETIEQKLRSIVAPEISNDIDRVAILHAYWGDLAAQLAWDGASCLPDETRSESVFTSILDPFSARSHILADLRQPLNQIGARFFGDIFCYLNNRGDAESPGPVPQRILDVLHKANHEKELSGEPLVVLTNSMGGQIMYDIVTYYLPQSAKNKALYVDLWCSVASQIGLFEEMKLFMASSNLYSKAKGNRVPFPDRNHLGTWWNVWDVDDIISYSVRDIIEGVDDMQFRVGQPLLKEHTGYLQEDSFYRLFAEKVKAVTTRS
jgi:hypothetical protein